MTGVRARWLFALVVLVGTGVVHADETTAGYAWKNVAIGGGGFVSGLVFHPRERGLLYARTDVGGAYRWDAAAQRWSALTDWLGAEDVNLAGIESIALDPADPERVYLAAGTYTTAKTGNGAVLRSSDRGRSFQRSDLPFKLGANELGRGNGERLAVDPNDGRVLFFGSRDAGLWRSGDHGASWSKVASFPAIATSDAARASNAWRRQPVGIVFVVFDPRSGSTGAPTPTLYAGVSTRATSLYRSDDGGASWAPVAGQPAGLRPNHMVRASNGAYFLSYGDEPGPDSMRNGAVWKFEPAVGRWTDITPAPQSIDSEGDGFGWGAVSVDPHDPDVLLATTFCRYGPHDEIFRSTDGGKHWTSVLERSLFEHDSAPWTRDATPHWMADIEIDPFDPDRALFVTGYGIWASRNLRALDHDDGGKVTWRFENAGLEETVALDLASPPQGAHLLSALGDIDGFRHDDLNASPLQYAGPRLTNGESIDYAGQAAQIVVRSGTVRHRVHNEIRAAHSADGGKTWTSFASEPPEGEGAGQIAIAADGKRVIWTPDKATHAWITTDFGKRWQKVKGVPAGAVIEADKVDAAFYYAFDGITGKLYVSGNGGVEFKEVAAGVGEAGNGFRPEIHADPQRSAVVYLTASWRGLLRWSAGKLERLPGVEHADSLGLGKPKEGSSAPTLFVSGKVDGKAGLFRSDDDGHHWQRIDDDAHRYGKISLVTGDPRLYGRVYFAGSGRGIVYGDPR
ncbi:MAG: cellulase [Luteimonas sp.]|nr:cellulase [Luteimonas sp.]